MPDLSFEFSKREALMQALAAEFAQNEVLTSGWLGNVDFGFGPERIKDTSKGIWNPSSYAGTLTIVSDPDGEYDDGDHGDSLYRYSYEKRPPGQDPRGGVQHQAPRGDAPATPHHHAAQGCAGRSVRPGHGGIRR